MQPEVHAVTPAEAGVQPALFRSQLDQSRSPSSTVHPVQPEVHAVTPVEAGSKLRPFVVTPAEAGVQSPERSEAPMKQLCVYLLASQRNGTLYVASLRIS